MGLGLQDSSLCIPFMGEFQAVITPSDSAWQNIKTSIEALKLDPKEPEIPVCDGFEVQCHITFKSRLLKFSIFNPEFKGFTEFRDLLNEFTVCSDYSNGLFEVDR
jgi:hypothetical protein